MDLKGKIVLLTGATSGIGRAAAELFAREGATLVLPVRTTGDGEKVRSELLTGAPNAQIEIFSCDLASFQSIRNFIKDIKAKYNHIDILINNAGVFPQEREVSTDGHELNLAVNYLAPVLITRGLTDLLEKSNAPRVINVSSSMCREGKIDFGDLESKNFDRYKAYAQSKLALVLFTKKFAQEVKETNIVVNALHPGVIKTSLALQPLQFTNKILRAFFMLRMQRPEIAAKRVMYLATNEGISKISGEYFEKNKIIHLPESIIKQEIVDQLDLETRRLVLLTK